MQNYPKTKQCSQCKNEKELELFYTSDSGTKFGRSSKCIECDQKRAREFYRNNKEKWTEEEKLLIKENNRKRSAKHRANPKNTIKLRYLKERYGITVEDYLKMHADQNGLCAICGNPPNGMYHRLHVDHNHKTNKVRQLLCFSCNVLLGNANDNSELLIKAAEYLKKHLK